MANTDSTKTSKGEPKRFQVGDVALGVDGKRYLIVPDSPHRLTDDENRSLLNLGAQPMRLYDANGRNAKHLK